ncbi:MAG: hypothetical protein LBS60_13660 [Deltaproteobacteria bacterium]|jgi:hypothetical protein|nr:hypothetical protein [Deltaproteobacteria bacterium]
MSKQAMNVYVLADFIVNSFGVSQVLVEKNNRNIIIEPMLTNNSDSANPENSVDETKAGALSLDDFTEVKLFTKGYKFNRDDAYE